MEKKKIRFAAWNIQGPKGGKNGSWKKGDPDSENRIRSLINDEQPDFAFFQEPPPTHCMPGLDSCCFSERISCREEDNGRGIVFYHADPAYTVTVIPGSSDAPVAAGYIVKSGTQELFRVLGLWNIPYETDTQTQYFNNFSQIAERFQKFCREAQNLIIVGDTNLILHAEAYAGDESKQKECRKMQQKLADKMQALGLPPVYTVADHAGTLKWDGNGEWYQCDLLFVSESLRDGLRTGLGRRDRYVDELGSDHVPVFAEFFI